MGLLAQVQLVVALLGGMAVIQDGTWLPQLAMHWVGVEQRAATVTPRGITLSMVEAELAVVVLARLGEQAARPDSVPVVVVEVAASLLMEVLVDSMAPMPLAVEELGVAAEVLVVPEQVGLSVLEMVVAAALVAAQGVVLVVPGVLLAAVVAAAALAVVPQVVQAEQEPEAKSESGRGEHGKENPVPKSSRWQSGQHRRAPRRPGRLAAAWRVDHDRLRCRGGHRRCLGWDSLQPPHAVTADTGVGVTRQAQR